MTNEIFFIGLLSISLACGCTAQQESPSENQQSKAEQAKHPTFPSIKTSNVFAYECGSSLQFSAHVTKDSTWLFLPDTSLKVMPVPSGSGARYEGQSYLYWSKGDEALLQRPVGSLMKCKVLPKEKARGAAKIRGVDFRALGQEPGWILEITEGEQIKYVHRYGKDTVYTPVPDPKIDKQQRTVYQAETETHQLLIEITAENCTDVMSGFKFPKTVEVTFDGKTYQGCGRKL